MNHCRYFLRKNSKEKWTEVTRTEWIRAKRKAGFRPKYASTPADYMDICATGGFRGNGIEGKISFSKE